MLRKVTADLYNTSASAVSLTQSGAALVSAETVVADTVRFAGEVVAVQRILQRGSREERRAQETARKRKQKELGGQFGVVLRARRAISRLSIRYLFVNVLVCGSVCGV